MPIVRTVLVVALMAPLTAATAGAQTIQPYQAQTVQPYKAPTVQPYQAPTVQAYKAPNVQAYQAPTIQQYQAPTVQQYKAPTVQQYNAPTVQKHTAPTVQPAPQPHMVKPLTAQERQMMLNNDRNAGRTAANIKQPQRKKTESGNRNGVQPNGCAPNCGYNYSTGQQAPTLYSPFHNYSPYGN